MAELERGLRKNVIGIVTSNKMDKTITVKVYGKVSHPIYKKTINHTTTYVAHDENNECSIGDTVEIAETRPMSKNKRWRLVRIVEKVK